MNKEQDEWSLVITPRDKWYQVNLKEIWTYRDLLFLMVKRDFVAVYKQTILGPIWFILQPLLTSTTYTIILSLVAGMSTEEIPPLLFYLSGLTFWGIFSETVTKTSVTFTENASVFGKVYFPRLIVPISAMMLNLIKFGVQFIMFLLFLFYYMTVNDKIDPQWAYLAALPILILIMAVLALGFGVLISALTTKYRDLQKIVGFGTQLLMHASFVIIPIAVYVPEEYQWIAYLNPMTNLVEAFKFIFLGAGTFSWMYIGYSALFAVGVLGLAILVFHRVEKTFTDTV